MAFNIIRVATDEDRERLAAAWRRFCDRYPDPWVVDKDTVGLIEGVDMWGCSTAPLCARWERCALRALRLPLHVDIRHPVGIVSGYVGSSGW